MEHFRSDSSSYHTHSFLDSLHTAFCIILLYYYLIANFGNASAWRYLNWYVRFHRYFYAGRYGSGINVSSSAILGI